MSIVKFHKKEDKIYSRKRIIIPKINYYRADKLGKPKNFNIVTNNPKKFFRLFVILIIEILVSRNIIVSLNPIINNQCLNKAKNLATIITNEQATVVMENYKYEDLAVVIKDDSGKIQMIKLNIIPVNEIISDVALKIQNELNNVDSTNIGIRMGSFSGIKLFSGVGPKISFRMSSIGNVETNLKSQFKTAGINQTLHQIYLEISCEILVLTPYDSVSEKIYNQILIAESIIIGEIPGSYYNFNGADNNDAIRAID